MYMYVVHVYHSTAAFVFVNSHLLHCVRQSLILFFSLVNIEICFDIFVRAKYALPVAMVFFKRMLLFGGNDPPQVYLGFCAIHLEIKQQ